MKVDIARMLVEEPDKLIELYEKGEIIADTPSAREALEAAVAAARDKRVVELLRDLLSHADPRRIVEEYASLSSSEKKLIDRLAEAGIITGWSRLRRVLDAILAAAEAAGSIVSSIKSIGETLVRSDAARTLIELIDALDRRDYGSVIKYVDKLLSSLDELKKLGIKVSRDTLLKIKAFAEMMIALNMLHSLPHNPDEAYTVAEEARKLLEDAAAYLPVARELYGIMYEEPSISTLECIANKYIGQG